MKVASIVLEVLSTALGVLVWWLGWPTLRMLNTALMIFSSLAVLVFVSFGVAFLFLIIRAQIAPPYE